LWAKEEFSKCKGLKGRTIGILGFGNIGTEIAKRALAFEMKVLVKSIVFSSHKVLIF
jgi:D-3-phosphoglycerate dehydrogenase